MNSTVPALPTFFRPSPPLSAPPLIDRAKSDVLAYMAVLKRHWAKLRSTYPIERLNSEIKRSIAVTNILAL
jgi:transposase-like protein